MILLWVIVDPSSSTLRMESSILQLSWSLHKLIVACIGHWGVVFRLGGGREVKLL